MKVKIGASIDRCRPEILIAAITVIDPIFNLYGEEAVITSGTEDCHHNAKRSRHYSGDALDFRHRFFDTDTKREILKELKKELGGHFVVILEKTHFHIHFAPVYGY